MKIPMPFWGRNRKTHVKFYMKSQGTLKSQNNFEKEEQSWNTHTFRFQNLYKVIVWKHHGTGIKVHIDQWNRIGSLKTNLCI